MQRRLAPRSFLTNVGWVGGCLIVEAIAWVELRMTLIHSTRVPESTVYQAGRIHFNVEAAGLRVPVIDPELVRMLVKGQTVPQAQIRLATALHLSGLPQITDKLHRTSRSWTG